MASTKKSLCCITNPMVTCKHCGDTFCADHGRPRNGINKKADEFAEKHWTINQCRKRYSKEQLRESLICYETRMARDDEFKRRALQKKYKHRFKPIKDIKDRCDLCKSHFRGRNDRQWHSAPKFEF